MSIQKSREKNYSYGKPLCCGALGSMDETQPMWINDIECNGNESALINCTWDNNWDQGLDCRRNQSVGVVCYNQSKYDAVIECILTRTFLELVRRQRDFKINFKRS